MKKTKSSLTSVLVPVLSGIIGMLIVLVAILGYSAINQRNKQEIPAIAPGVKDASAYPAEYQIQFEQSWKARSCPPTLSRVRTIRSTETMALTELRTAVLLSWITAPA